MNNITINLSSNDTTYTSVLSNIYLEDHTTLSIDIQNVSDTVIPTYMKIDWGDGTSKLYNNDIPQQTRDSLNVFSYSNLLESTYDHEYYPSQTTLFKNLTAQVLINYSNGDYAWFILPITIRTYDYFESIYDLTLVNTNILPTENNNKQHQFISTKDRFTLELSD